MCKHNSSAVRSTIQHYHAEELAEFLSSPQELIYWLIYNDVLAPNWVNGEPWFSKDYLDELNDFDLTPSNSGKGKPYENPIAERINGILKHEFQKRMPRTH